MGEEFGVAGAGLASGLAQGYAQGLERKRDREQQAIKNEYIKSQKRLVDMQFKAAEALENWWAQQPPHLRRLRHMPEDLQTAAFLLNYKEPPPKTQLPVSSPTQPDIADQIFAGEPVTAQQQTDPLGLGEQAAQYLMGGWMGKKLGFNPMETEKYPGMAGPGGQPVTQIRNRWTGELERAYPEAQQWVAEEYQTPEGATRRGYRPKYGPPPGAGGGVTVGGRPAVGGQRALPAPTPGGPMPGGPVVKQPEVETIRFVDEEGRKWEQDINKVTREPLPDKEPRLLEKKKGLPAESAGKLSMLWGGKEDLEDFIDLVSIKDDQGNIIDWNRKILFQMAPSVPYLGGIGPFYPEPRAKRRTAFCTTPWKRRFAPNRAQRSRTLRLSGWRNGLRQDGGSVTQR